MFVVLYGVVVLDLDPDCGYSQYPDAGREGGKSSSKIVGGWESRIHEFPYQVGVPTAFNNDAAEPNNTEN